MYSPVSPKDEIWFLRVCHHFSTGLYPFCSVSSIHVNKDSAYKNLFYLSGFICMHNKNGGDSSTRLPKVQKCTAVENTFVKSATFDIAFFHGLDMHLLQIKLYSYKNNLAIDMTRHKAHLVYYFVPRNIPSHSIYGATAPSGPWPPS